MVIFHSYVNLPEGNYVKGLGLVLVKALTEHFMAEDPQKTKHRALVGPRVSVHGLSTTSPPKWVCLKIVYP